MLFRSVEGWTETPVDVFRSEARVELDFLLKDESFKLCLSDGDSFGGPPGLAQLLGVPFSLHL